jgi:hypothetical protein
MTFSPEKPRKPGEPEKPNSLLERAAKKGGERLKRIEKGTEGIRKVLKALLAPEVLVGGVAKAALEGGVIVSLAGLELLLGAAALAKKGLETASKSLEGKVREAKTRALARLAGLGERGRAYGRFSTEGIRVRIEEISLATKKSSFERELRKIRGEKGRVTSITVEGIDERKGRTSKVADAEWLAFLSADIKRVEGIDERAKATSERIRTFSWRIEAIRNKRMRGEEARRAIMRSRVIGIDVMGKERV